MSTPLRLTGLAAALSATVSMAALAQAPTPLPLTLVESVRLGGGRSAPVASARFLEAAAHAQAGERRSMVLPKLAASAGTGERTFNPAVLGLPPANGEPMPQVIGPVRGTDVRIRADWTVLNVTDHLRFAVAREDATIAAYQTEAAAQDAAAATASLYVEALRAHTRVSAAHQDSVRAAMLLEIARARMIAALAPAVDTVRAAAQVVEASAQLVAARGGSALARIELQRAIGTGPWRTLVLRDSLASAEAMLAALIESTSRDTRPELLAATAAVASAARATQAARSEWLPVVSLHADVGAGGTAQSRLRNTYSWGVQASLPVFDGLRRQRSVAGRSALHAYQQSRRHALAERLAAEDTSAVVALEMARALRGTAAARQALATRELDVVTERYESGLAGQGDVIAAQEALSRASQESVDADARVVLAGIALLRARGRIHALR